MSRPTTVLDRFAFFRGTYIAVFALALLYVLSVGCAESALESYFRAQIEAAAKADPAQGSVVAQIRERVTELAERSAWVSPGGVEVHAVVLGHDGRPIYVRGLPEPEPAPDDPEVVAQEAARVLPADVSVAVAVPHNSLVANAFLVAYAATILTSLYFRQRAQVQRQAGLLAEAVGAREAVARRASAIEQELDDVRRRVVEATLSESEHAREIDALSGERVALREKLAELERREAELVAQQQSASPALDTERQALEELLDEALADLQQKDDEIQQLQSRLKRASRDVAATASARARETDLLGRRLRTLYRNLEVDERAVEDLVELRDEAMKLKAEEILKRLSDEVETAGARRKVGGLPPGLPVFEVGYAGKGRIYYTHGTQRRLRVLCVGAKNSQKTDLEYLSRVVVRG